MFINHPHGIFAAVALLLFAEISFSSVALAENSGADEWEVSESNGFVDVSITGKITYGERQRFLFLKRDCDKVQHVFSTYTRVQANFDGMAGEIFVIDFNGEKIGAELMSSRKAMAGHLLIWDLGVYDRNVLLPHVSSSEKIAVRFVDGNGRTANDYFHATYNEWSTQGMSVAFDRAHAVCSKKNPQNQNTSQAAPSSAAAAPTVIDGKSDF